MKIQNNLVMIMLIVGAMALKGQSPAEAVNYLENEDGTGLRAMSMGNAYTAAAEDGSALYWNPAALTQLENSEISGALYYTHFRNNAIFSNNSVEGDETFTRFKSFDLAYKFPTARGSFVIAVGRHNIKDYDDYLNFNGFNSISNGLEFDLGETQEEYHAFDENVWQSEEVTQDGHLGAWSLGCGLAVSPQLNIGVTAHAWTGGSHYQFQFNQEDRHQVYTQYPANYDSYELRQEIESEYSGFGLTAGTLINLNEQLKIGVSIDFPTGLKVKESYNASDLLVFDDGYESALDLGGGEWEYIVRYPMKLNGGIAIDTENLLLAASASYRDWTETRFDKPDSYYNDDDYRSLLDENPAFKQNFRAVLSYGVGGEFRFTGPNVKVRGGYRIAPSPLANADKSLNRQYITAGLGIDLDASTQIAMTYIHGWWTRYSEDSYTPGETKESIETDRVLIGMTYRF